MLDKIFGMAPGMNMQQRLGQVLPFAARMMSMAGPQAQPTGLGQMMGAAAGSMPGLAGMAKRRGLGAGSASAVGGLVPPANGLPGGPSAALAPGMIPGAAQMGVGQMNPQLQAMIMRMGPQANLGFGNLFRR